MYAHKVASRLIIILLALTFACVLNPSNMRAQQEAKQEARKFEEFGDIEYSTLIAFLDNFAIQLQSEPTARGFIIVYRTRRDLPGLSNRYAMRSRNYLVKTRGLPAARIVTVDGGVANCLTQELWIVPPGATPKPRSDAYNNSFVDTDTARKFDEHYVELPGDLTADGWSPESEDMAANLDGFALELQKEPQARAYIIAYSQYYIERGIAETLGKGGRTYSRLRLDASTTAWKIGVAERNYLIKTYGIAPSRIRLVNGGYRNLRQVELWIVPRGASTPVPTPNRFPKRRA